MRTAPLRLAAFGALLVAAFAASSARASKSYPETLEAALDLSCPPACTTCHSRPEGGELTANTPLGISLRRAGLDCCNNGLLRDVIATLEANATDSDSDGVPDVDELRAGTDPNAAEGKLECYVPEPEEGCTLAPRTPSTERAAGAWSGFGLGLAALVALRRARRRQSQ